MDKARTPFPTLPAGPALSRARRFVAGALLEQAGNPGRARLTVRDMVAASGTDWESIRLSLRTLQEEGAIRLERHRIFIHADLLRAAADGTGPGSPA